MEGGQSGGELIENSQEINSDQNNGTIREPIVKYHYIYQELTPTIYTMTVQALKLNPTWAVLHYNGGGTEKINNRTEALKKVKGAPAGPGRSWDEFPYAMTMEGGKGAILISAPVKEQQIQAGALGKLVTQGTRLQRGDNIIVIPVPSMKPVEQPSPSFDIFPIIIRSVLRRLVPIPVIR